MIKERKKVGLAILDEFFVSLNNPSTAAPCRVVSPWEHIRCVVPEIGRSFRPSSSDVADMELGFQTSSRAEHSRHIDDAPSPSQPSTSHRSPPASKPDVSVVQASDSLV